MALNTTNIKTLSILFFMVLLSAVYCQEVQIEGPIVTRESPFITENKQDFIINLKNSINVGSRSFTSSPSNNRVYSYIKNEGEGVYTFRIELEDVSAQRTIRQFAKTFNLKGYNTDDESDFGRKVLDWIMEIGSNINYFLGAGKGTWKKEIRVYLPNIEEPESVKPLSVDSINADEIQDEIIYLLTTNPDFQNKCIAQKIEKEYNKHEKETYPTQAKLYFNYFILNSEASHKQIELNINVTYKIKCYRNEDPLKIGTQNNWKSTSIKEHINKNWIKAILVNQDCSN